MKKSYQVILLLLPLITLVSCDGLVFPSSSDPTTTDSTTSDTSLTTDSNTDSTSSEPPIGESYWVHFETYANETIDSIFTNYIQEMPLVNNAPLYLSGWYLESSYHNIISFPYVVTSEVTLHAKWDEININDFAFELTNDNQGYKLISYGGNTHNLIIPSIYKEKPVLEIGPYVFAYNGVIQYVTLPSSLRRINLAAFKDCIQLTSLTLPNTLTYLDTDAFSGCNNLSSITLSTNLKVIGNNAFEGIKITSIILHNKVEEIRSRAFANNLKLDEVILHSLTPPLRFNNSFEGTKNSLIYKVPSNLVSIYKENEYWKAFKDQIVSQ